MHRATGETRLDWVLGAGFDWKMTPNVLPGLLYRHHEFPSGAVSFVDDSGGSGRPVSFGTSRATVASIQGRLSCSSRSVEPWTGKHHTSFRRSGGAAVAPLCIF
jgi:hypothetical protein